MLGQSSIDRSAEAREALPRVTLVLGGARSGKSRHAEAMIERAGGGGIYLATAAVGDAEMAARVAAHRERRGPQWTTIEETLEIAARLREASRPVLVDCLTLWLSNLMHAGRDPAAASEALLATLATMPAPAVLVANEVGLGIVPENALARAFRDHAGHLHQRVAAAADRVVLMAAGLPLVLKDTVAAETSR